MQISFECSDWGKMGRVAIACFAFYSPSLSRDKAAVKGLGTVLRWSNQELS